MTEAASQSAITDEEASEHLFSEFALVGPATFFGDLAPADELDGLFRNATGARPREYFILRTLAEVQKYGVAATRWAEVHQTSNDSGPASELRLESVYVEQAAWRRRLLEALLLLVNFSTTNDHAFFADYLALMKHDRVRYQVREEKDFFGATSELTQLKVAASEQRVDAAIRALPESADRWYAHPKDRFAPATTRSLFMRALGHALPSERTALGYTYGLSFGGASELLHFSVLDAGESDATYKSAIALCGLLAIAIVGRAHDLCSVTPTGLNALALTRDNRYRPTSSRLADTAKLGDFVVVNRPPILGEVVERRSTSHGYDCYLIEFLDAAEDQAPTQRDWIPAPAVARVMHRDSLIADTRRLIQEHAPGTTLSDAELLDATRRAIVEAWRMGLKAYTMRPSVRDVASEPSNGPAAT